MGKRIRESISNSLVHTQKRSNYLNVSVGGER